MWAGSEVFVTVLAVILILRGAQRVLHGRWRFRHEWFAFILVFPLILGLYLWIANYRDIFLFGGGILFVFWALYVREIMDDLQRK